MRIRLLYIIKIAALMSVISCSDLREPDYSVFILEPEELSFAQKGGSQELHIQCGAIWKVKEGDKPEWLTVDDVKEGKKAYEWVITLSCEANEDFDRSENLTIITNAEQRSVTVKQPGSRVPDVLVESVSLKEKTKKLKIEETFKLEYTIEPEHASNQSVTWRSTDETVGTVEKDGTVTALSEGETDIIITTADGNKQDTCHFTIVSNIVKVEKIELEPQCALKDGDSTILVPKIIPPDAFDQSVTWSSDDEIIATVDENGKVKAFFPGEVNITATTNDGNIPATCKVTVELVRPEAIDLGLPSGLKWASFPLGASGIDKEGDMFAWGEIKPKKEYNWENYSKCEGTYNTLTEYNDDNQYGKVDNKTVLEAKDDAASVLLKGEWRMPEKVEFMELLDTDNCSWTIEDDYLIFNNANKSDDASIRIINSYYWTASLRKPSYTASYYSKSSHQITWANRRVKSMILPVCGPKPIHAKSITIDKGQSIIIGKQLQLQPVIEPQNATYQKLVFFSSDDTIATVSSNGEVTAIAVGNATITVSMAYEEEIKTECEITVEPVPYEIKMKESYTLNDGETFQLEAIIDPPEVGTKTITWSSEDEIVASVSSKGLVTAKFPGETKIKASTKDGKSAICTVKVNVVRPEAIDLGLPSGLKWASFPLGAPGEGQAGDKFAWGELKPKKNFYWKNYRFWESGDSSSVFIFNKYVTDDNYGKKDNLSVLQASDDAATLLLGSLWRMPDITELRELMDEENTKWSYKDNTWIITSINNSEASLIFSSTWTGNLGRKPNYATYFALTIAGGTHGFGLYVDSRKVCKPIQPVFGPKPVHITSFSLKQEDKRIVLKGGESKKIEPVITPPTATYKKLKLSTSNPDVVEVNNDGTLTAVGEGPATVTVETAYEEGFKETCSVSVPITTIQTPEAIDLGLPSEVLWGSFNIGATAQYEEGLEYAWGENEPKEKYNWDNYLWGTSDNLTKYNDSDKKTVLDPSDDVATFKLGNGWRMPTEKEISDLFNDANCKLEWDIKNGVNGYTVKSLTNGNSIFFPVTRSSTHYWSSSLSSGSSAFTYYYYSSSTNTNGRGAGSRYFGYYVRPVYDEQRESTISPVDMGLSVMWASCNLGAISENGYGDYYAWGEIKPKDEFTLDNYKYYNKSTEKYTKYVTDSSYGYVDNKIVLEKGDDAAYASLGGNWKTPTKEEWQELIDNCTWTWRHNGYLVSSPKTGNSIFLPASGYGGQYPNKGNAGHYHSSSLNETRYPFCLAFSINYTDDKYSVYGYSSRYKEKSIRPVCEIPLSQVSFSSSSKTVEEDETVELTVKFEPKNATRKDLKWYSSNTSVATIDENTGAITIVGRGNTTITATPVYGGTAATCTLKVNAASFKAVDMGTSVKWSNMNLGAKTCEEYGDYYAWAATQPKTPYSQDNAPYWGVNKYTKYTSSYSRLDNTDDAATQLKGSGWRIPTADDFSTLMNNCNYKGITKNGVDGLLLTSKTTNNSIFFPYAGYYKDSDLKDGYLYYWTSVVDPSNSRYAKSAVQSVHDGPIYIGYDLRYYGLPIRAVLVK